jgi:hypothetical protein
MLEGEKKELLPDGGELDKEISALIAKLDDPSRPTRREARRRLFALGQAAMPAIITTLFNGPENSRWQIAKALGHLHDPAIGPALVKALQDESFGVRWLAAEGLMDRGSDGLGPLLEGLIADSDSIWLREGARHVLHFMHESGLEREAYAAVEGVLAALEGGEPTVAVPAAAEIALKQIEKFRREALGH